MKRGDRVRYGYLDNTKKHLTGTVVGVDSLGGRDVVVIAADSTEPVIDGLFKIMRYEKDVELLDAGD